MRILSWIADRQSYGAEGSVLADMQIFLLERAPASGADRVFAVLEGGESGVDAGRVAIRLVCGQHLLRGADRGAMGLRRIDAQPETHHLELAGRHHRGLPAL